MDFKITQETFLLAAKLVKLALVGNLINQEGCDAAVVVGKLSPSTCRTIVERPPAILAHNVT